MTSLLRAAAPIGAFYSKLIIYYCKINNKNILKKFILTFVSAI